MNGEKESKIVVCPNCQRAARMYGSNITCEHCDAIYKVTKTGAAKVKSTGAIEDHERRLAALEAHFPGEKPEPELEPEPEPESDEDQILPG